MATLNRRKKYNQQNTETGEAKIKENVRQICQLSQNDHELHDPNLFLLDNILLGVQFFSNYERDIGLIRENVFEEKKFSCHHITCFYGESLQRLIDKNVKFRQRHGKNKNIEEPLHPFRLFVTRDNIKLGYDPSAFAETEPNREPKEQYYFIVKPCDNDKKKKLGYVNLLEYSVIDPQHSEALSPDVLKKFASVREQHYERKPAKNSRCLKSIIETKGRKSTRGIDKSHAFAEKEIYPDYSYDMIPSSGCYRHLKRTPGHFLGIHEYKMNDDPETSYEIPKKCYQIIDSKCINLEALNKIIHNTPDVYFNAKTLLNSAAFKGHFCDILIDHLAEPLNVSMMSLNNSFVQGEYVVMGRNPACSHLTSSIELKNDNLLMEIKRKPNTGNSKRLTWPSPYMEKILHSLPKYLVPTGYLNPFEENLEYEKEWKIEFPKDEEYLSTHMLHTHLRCYLFVLTIYKTFIETDINVFSFGPKHLLHLLFWQVQKNFLAWPDEAEGDTLLRFLRSLYKSLQKKSLPNFFLPSRNLFAESQPKDLHWAQSVLKLILEDPVPYVMKAVRNLKLQPDFFPELNATKLAQILKNFNPTLAKKLKKTDERFKATETGREMDVTKRFHMEKIIDEEDNNQNTRPSIDSIDINKEFVSRLNFDSTPGCKLLKYFISHFLKMTEKSVEYRDIFQGELYLSQIKKLSDILPKNALKPDEQKCLNQKIKILHDACGAISPTKTNESKT